MSKEEREAFARDGSLPDWFSRAIGATPGDGQEAEKDSQVTENQRVQQRPGYNGSLPKPGGFLLGSPASRVLEVGSLIVGTERWRRYCAEPVCADFLAGRGGVVFVRGDLDGNPLPGASAAGGVSGECCRPEHGREPEIARKC
jgi:hypothetical protein